MSEHTLPDGYRLMENGDVVSFTGWRGHRGRLLTPMPNKDGYLYVRVQLEDGTRAKRYIHQLVAWAYAGSRPTPAHEVRHLDGKCTNNHRLNIAWGTRKENADDRSAHGRSYRPDWSDPEKRARWTQAIRKGVAIAKARGTS